MPMEKKVYVICNPYDGDGLPRLEIDAKNDGTRMPIGVNSLLAPVQSEPLRKNLYAHGEWRGLFPMLRKVLGTRNFTIVYCGDIASYEELREAFQNEPDHEGMELIADVELSRNVSPADRLSWLDFQRGRWNDENRPVSFDALPWVWRDKSVLPFDVLDKMWTRCGEICEDTSLSPTEKVLRVQNDMRTALQEESEALRKKQEEMFILERAIHERYEAGLSWNFENSIGRCADLYPRAKRLLEWLESFDFIKARPEYPSPAQIAETEIGGKTGRWADLKDAQVRLKEFQDALRNISRKVLSDCRKQWDYFSSKVWSARTAYEEEWLRELHADPPEMAKTALPPLSVYVEESQVPSYWPGQPARTVRREYVELGSVEARCVEIERAQFQQALEKWAHTLRGKLDDLMSEIGEYRRMLQELLSYQNATTYCEKLISTIEDLTRIDRFLQKEPLL